jgi:hypothetical protein
MTPLGPITIIARLTLREAVRRRLLWVLLALTVVIVALTAWAFGRIDDLSPVSGATEMAAVSQILVMLAFMFSFVLAMTAVFAAAPAIGPEIESGLLLAVLARPIRRSDVLLGRWLGLAAIVSVYALVAGYLELGAVAWATGYWPADPWLAPWYLATQALVLLTLALAMSARIASVAGGALAVVGYGLAWMAGIMGGIGNTLDNDVLRWAGSLSRLILPSDVPWRGAMHALEPPPSVMDAGGLVAQAFRISPFFAGSGPEPIWLAWCAAWIVAVLALGIALLNRREV